MKLLESKWTLLLLLPALIGIILYASGPIVSFDHYLIGQGTRSLLLQGKIAPFGSYEGWFPPYVFSLYALLIKISSSPLRSFAQINFLFMALSLTLIYKLLRRENISQWTGLGITLWIGMGKWFGMTHSWITADPLYLVLILMIPLIINDLDESLSWKKIISIILILNLGFLARSLMVIPYVILSLLAVKLLRKKKIPLTKFLALVLLSPLSQGIWMIRNYLVGLPSVWGRFSTPSDNLWSQLFDSNWKLLEALGSHLSSLPIPHVLGAVIFITALIALRDSFKRENKIIHSSLLPYSLFYIGASILLFTFLPLAIGATFKWDQRMVISLLPFLAFILADSIQKLSTRRWGKWILISLLLIKLVEYAYWIPKQYRYNREGPMTQIEASPSVQFIRALPLEQNHLIISNAHHILYSMISPLRAVTDLDRPPAQRTQFVTQLTKEKRELFLWLLNPKYNYYYNDNGMTLSDFEKTFVTEEILHDDFASLYRLKIKE